MTVSLSPPLAKRTMGATPHPPASIWIGAVLIAGLGVALGGCAGHAPAPTPGPVFPPHPLRPLRVAIAPPLQTLDLPLLHESLADWSSRPSERRQLVACTWQEGVPALAGMAWPATELSAVVMSRWPLGPTSRWCTFAGRDPDSLVCTLTAAQPVDYARRRGLSHLVIPRALAYHVATVDRDTFLQLTAELAIVDIIEARVVWTGLVAARREDMLRFHDLQPELTAFEQATYAWLIDLARVFARIETWPARDDGLRDVALRCHRPPRVFPSEDLAVGEPAIDARDAETGGRSPGDEPLRNGAPSTGDPATTPRD